MKYRFHPDALVEIEVAADYYAECQKGLELRYIDAVTAGAGGGTSQENYRLDDLWLLSCLFSTRNGTLMRSGLWQHWRNIWVAPPPTFTGAWTTYYANEQRSHEIHYVAGLLEGKYTTFFSDGSESSVNQYHLNKLIK